jgi:hypothetical protein
MYVRGGVVEHSELDPPGGAKSGNSRPSRRSRRQILGRGERCAPLGPLALTRHPQSLKIPALLRRVSLNDRFGGLENPVCEQGGLGEYRTWCG